MGLSNLQRRAEAERNRQQSLDLRRQSLAEQGLSGLRWKPRSVLLHVRLADSDGCAEHDALLRTCKIRIVRALDSPLLSHLRKSVKVHALH